MVAALTVVGVSILAGPESRTYADQLGEPLTPEQKAMIAGVPSFIADTGRLVTHPDGRQEIVWDTPELPGVEESLVMMAAAKAARDTSLLPLCSPEFREYSRAHAIPRDRPPSDFWDAPGCTAIPDHASIGPCSTPGSPGSPFGRPASSTSLYSD